MTWLLDALQISEIPRILEVGAGIGTMLERLLERGVLTHAHYTAIDAEEQNISYAVERFPTWADDRGYDILSKDRPFVCGKGYQLLIQDQEVEVTFCPLEMYDFVGQQKG